MSEDTPTYKKIFSYLRTKVKESIDFNKSAEIIDGREAMKEEESDIFIANDLNVDVNLIKMKEENFNKEILKNIEINKIIDCAPRSMNVLPFEKGYDGFEDSIEVLDGMCQQQIGFQMEKRETKMLEMHVQENNLKKTKEGEENNCSKRMKPSQNKFLTPRDIIKGEDSFNYQSGILVSKILDNGKIVFKKTHNKLEDKLTNLRSEGTKTFKLKEVKKHNVSSEEIKHNNPNNTISITILRKLLEIPTFTFKEFNFARFKNIKKIAEATYSEVYLIDNLIYKIIPFKLSDEKAFHKEVYLIKELSKYTNTPDFHNACILKGRFDKILVKKFEEFKNTKESINDHPLTYKCHFGVIIMEDCGKDLEAYEIQKHEVASFFQQLINQLCLLEKELEFEHRDLHWGNIMIKKEGEGILIKIIDFTLSRIKNNLGVLYMDLKKERDIFDCSLPDEQYSIYPQMKFLNKNNWKNFTPTTNLLWVKYLINKIETKVGEMHILNQMRVECTNCVNIESLKRKLKELKIF